MDCLIADVVDKGNFHFILGLPLVALGLYLSYKRTLALDKEGVTSTKRLTTDIFARSIKLLGDEKARVRQGAIYALGKLAREESSEQREVIMHTLCAYIRDKKLTNNEKGSTSDTEGSTSDIDIEAAVREIVKLSREIDLSKEYEEEENVKSLYNKYDLSNIRLKRADFGGADLSGFNLSDSCFEDECIFESVEFFGSNLVATDFTDA